MLPRAHRFRLLALLLPSVLLASPRQGLAQQPVHEAGAASSLPSTEQRRTAAKAKFQQGAAAFAAGHYKDAVDLFLDADNLAPSAPLSFNVALAYEDLGDEAGALRWYRDYLRRAPTARNADTVRSRIADLSAALAKKGVQQLTVLSTPSTATVAVDGHPLGVAPWTGELAPGKHELLLTLRGYEDAQRELELPAGEPIDVNVQLVPSTAPSLQPNQAKTVESRGPRLGPLPWIALGAGTAALGGALTFELLRRSAEHDAEQDPTQLGYQSRLQSEQDRQTVARVLLGVGGAFVVGGGVMLILDSRARTHAPAASAGLLCLPGLCSISAQGRF